MIQPDLPSSIPSQLLGEDFQIGTRYEGSTLDSTIPNGIHELFTGRHVHFTFNTRTAIRAAYDTLKLTPGDEVLVPAYNCGSEIDPLLHAGLSVTLYPVGRDLVADPEAIAKLLSPQTRAVYVTHYFGLLQPRLAQIRALCDAKGLRLMEDCALSLLSGAHPADGRTGDVAFFCFHKFFPVPGGSALVVNAGDLSLSSPLNRPPLRRAEIKFMARQVLKATLTLDRLKQMKRVLSRTSAAHTFHSSGTDQDIPRYYYFDPDLMGRRMSNLTARALWRVDLHEAIQRRRQNWQIYRELLVQVPQAEPLISGLPDTTCPHSMPILVPNRDRVAALMQADGFEVTAWWAGFHQGLDWTMAGDALILKNEVLSLPLDPRLKRPDIARIVEQLAANLSA